eukprot:GHVH01007596.1.p1 GENE.GHVH01007596.1~~GHVH01007596.1.p1  ORF type:complete len:1177 (+),score=148.22 GHVH01007596.1:181-3531(+)
MKQLIRSNACRLIRSDVDPNFFIEFVDIKLGAPVLEIEGQKTRLSPHMCRLRDLTYAAPILVNVELYKGRGDQGEPIVIRRLNQEIGRMPVMLKSDPCILSGKHDQELMREGECPMDPGGYFIVKGNERVIMIHEQLSKNRIICEIDNKGVIMATCTSVSAESKTRTQVILSKGRLYLRHNTFDSDIPLVIVFKAMGVITDQEIMQLCGAIEDASVTTIVLLSIEECIREAIFTPKQALLYLGRHVKAKSWGPPAAAKSGSTSAVISEALEVLHRVIISHAEGTAGQEFGPKIRFLSIMVKRVLAASQDKTHLDDKDYYGNKRVELAGQLLSLMFEDLFKRFQTLTKKTVDQQLMKYFQNRKIPSGITGSSGATAGYPDCFRNLANDIVTRGLQSALSTGNWNIQRFRMERSGVAQVLNRMSYIASLGMMTRINSQFDKGVKSAGPRALQPSQWGMLCPCDTPEGESCGLVKNLALMTHITTDDDDATLIRVAFSMGVEDANTLGGEDIHDKGTYIVFLNGILLGCHRRPKQFLRNFKFLRRKGLIGCFVSVYENESLKSISIASDGGRLCRPLYIVKDGIPLLTLDDIDKMKQKSITFDELLKHGKVEWVDVNEENNCFIALREGDIVEGTTHLEIDPFCLMGVVAGLVPYPNHNQSPRNTYQCAMGKQAMGAIAYNQFSRADTITYLLVYPMRPLCQSRTIELIGWYNLPAGQNMSVAVMSYSGYDIEDAIVMNRGAIDRGMGRCYVMKRYTNDCKRYPSGATDIILPPASVYEKTEDRKNKRVDIFTSALDQDGVVRVGEMVSQGQVFLNKHVPKDITMEPSHGMVDPTQFRPNTVKYKGPVPAFVEKVIFTENGESQKIYKVVLRQVRIPELGDKFSSRHGQKGVVGCVVPPEDMPFSETGWQPDLIMNPHGFPSRMTVGKMLELICGKAALQTGRIGFGTAFGGDKLQDMSKILISKGFHYSGKDVLHSGITGEMLQTYIFQGPIYYQKLKHMVQDKIHARGRGPRQLLTRQPTEGRAKEGGLRLGEMERDCLVAYGAANLLVERLMLSSDVFDVYICQDCGMMGTPGWCTMCKRSGTMRVVRMPYACKLLFQEMMAMNVACRLKLRNVTS